MTKYDLQLNTASIVNVPLQTYQEEFTFIINGKRFQATRLISDLLSPKISRMHAVDPTIETFCITTTQKGDFSYLLKLSNFQIQSIPDDILPFVSEVSEIFFSQLFLFLRELKNKIIFNLFIFLHNFFRDYIPPSGRRAKPRPRGWR